MEPPTNHSGNEGIEHRARLLRAFPDKGAQIERSYRDSSAFREICDDYVECVAILETITSGARRTPAEAADYEEMRERLEQEIRDWIEENPQ